MENSNGGGVKTIVSGLILIVVIIVLISIFSMFNFIQEGKVAVVKRLGEVTNVVQPGFYFKTPFIEDIETMSVRTKKLEVVSTASSKDLQDVTTQLAVQFNLINTEANIKKVYSELGTEYEVSILAPAVQEATKSATAKYSAEELITKRSEVKGEIYEVLKIRMASQGILISNVDIINFKFSKAFNHSIEQKVKAEQDALTAKNKLEQVKFEAEQKVAKAEAEATRIKLEAESLKNNGEDIIEKILAEAKLEAAKRWDGKLPTQMIPNAVLPLLNIK